MASRRRYFTPALRHAAVPVLSLDDDPFNWYGYERGDIEEREQAEEFPRDGYIDKAKDSLKVFFTHNAESVFYQRQLEVMFEKDYFHWITVKALVELVKEGFVAEERLAVANARAGIVVYRLSSYRYWRRDADEIVKLVNRFSDPDFTKAIGLHCETLFDAALASAGFIPKARNLNKYDGREWTRTKQNLDRVFERDGIAYGAEIKNTLGYIEKSELDQKTEMCAHLGLIPLFIVRMAPKSYVNQVRDAGGFTLIFQYQLYPFGQKAFADEVKAKLGLPTDSPDRIMDGTVQRLLKWHLKKHNLG